MSATFGHFLESKSGQIWSFCGHLLKIELDVVQLSVMKQKHDGVVNILISRALHAAYWAQNLMQKLAFFCHCLALVSPNLADKDWELRHRALDWSGKKRKKPQQDSGRNSKFLRAVVGRKKSCRRKQIVLHQRIAEVVCKEEGPLASWLLLFRRGPETAPSCALFVELFLRGQPSWGSRSCLWRKRISQETFA